MSANEKLEALLARTAIGDRDAFKKLYLATSAKLFGICLRILKERSLAEDALQEIYVKIWHKAHTYRATIARPITWMSKIAHNYAIDQLRAKRGGHVDIDDLMELQDPNLSPESLTIQSNEAQVLAACLDELKSEHAAAIRLAYLDGYTYEEISAQTDTAVNTIKTWVRRSLVKLKGCMKR